MRLSGNGELSSIVSEGGIGLTILLQSRRAEICVVGVDGCRIHDAMFVHRQDVCTGVGKETKFEAAVHKLK